VVVVVVVVVMISMVACMATNGNVKGKKTDVLACDVVGDIREDVNHCRNYHDHHDKHSLPLLLLDK